MALLFTTTALLALDGCAHVKIHDHEFCTDAGSLGAVCFHSMTSETRDIPQPTWDDFRFGQVCEDYSVYADLKRLTEQLCSVSNACDYDVKKKLDEFFGKLEKANLRLKNL